MPGKTPQTNPSRDDPVVTIDAAGRDEWIVSGPQDARALHVYRVAADDWLVSEVGRGSEGRGSDLAQALAALSAVQPAMDWWHAVPAALDVPGPEGR